MPDSAAVAIVGGGPAGAALAIRLASAGIEVAVFERLVEPKWRACGVFSSPLTRRRLADLGLANDRISELSRPISALALRTTRGVACRLEYAHGYACGFDRPRLDADLLDRARAAGAQVHAGTVVQSIRYPASARGSASVTVSPTLATVGAAPRVFNARLVVGADGPASLVARTAGVVAHSAWLSRAGITFHRSDPDALAQTQPMDGQFLFGDGWYVGVAPVPRARVNVGMVVPSRFLARPLEETIAHLLNEFPEPRNGWLSAPTTDSYGVAGRLAHRVSRASGNGFLLVGDACGFIDPLTGEGLHRALVSSQLAADAIVECLRGDRSALEVYDRRVRSRFRSKDVVSWVLQAFLARPMLLDYALRRLASRRRHREELTLVLTDQLPATRALDPRFLGQLLAP